MPKPLSISFPPLFEYQTPVITDSRPLKVLCWGAQAGKTRISLYAQSGYVLSKGERKNAWITRDGKFARDEFRLAGALIPRELLAEKPNRSDLVYRLTNGSEWWFFSGLEPDAFRGRSWASAVFNEASYCKPEGWREVVAPRLRDWALFNFTPKGERNWTFTDLWRLAGLFPDRWFRSKVTTLDNPTVDPKLIDSYRYAIPDAAYRQEILAEFISDFGKYFNAKPKCWIGAFEPHVKGARYAAGLDWAEIRDFTALAIRRIDVFPHRLVYFERLQHMEYTAQIAPLSKKLKEYGNPLCLADASESTANQLMRQAGCKVKDFAFTGASKPYLCDQLRVEFEQSGLVLPGSIERVKNLIATGALLVGTRVPAYTEDQARQVLFLNDEYEFFEPYLRAGRLQLGARGEHHDDILAAIMLSGEAFRKMAGDAGGFLAVGRGGRGGTIIRGTGGLGVELDDGEDEDDE